MKKLITTLGLSLAFSLSATSVMADDSFQALNNMPEATFNSLTDKQLASVEGTYYYFPSVDLCVGCANIAIIGQTNINIGGGAHQTNNAVVVQSIN